MKITPRQIIQGLPPDELSALAAGVYDERFPSLKAAYLDVLADNAWISLHDGAAVEDLPKPRITWQCAAYEEIT